MMRTIKGKTMKRPAFTILELVIVIVLIGILASLTVPRVDRDIRQEAADSILSSIRYTQHLALLDDKHQFNKAKWQQRYWRIVFNKCGSDYYYMIGTDDNKEDANNAFFDINESAIDPNTGKPMFYACSGVSKDEVSKNVFIGEKYGITDITRTGGCDGTVNGSGGKHIGFDHLGRPHYGFSASTTPNYASIMTQACIFTFTISGQDDFSIRIEPMTGYAYIVGQPDS